MQVHVLSQEKAVVLTPEDNTVVISITNPGHTAALLEGWDAVLRVKFHGMNHVPKPDPPRKGFPGYIPKVQHIILFDEVHREQIDGFAHANHNKNFIVHCNAGLHRSVSVACYLRDVFGHELDLLAEPEDLDIDPVYLMLMRPYEGILS